jgi:hypothetical protein
MLTMDNTVIDSAGKGVESGSRTCSALGIGGRPDVGDFNPWSSSWLINLDKIVDRAHDARSLTSSTSLGCCIPSAFGTPKERPDGDDMWTRWGALGRA